MFVTGHVWSFNQSEMRKSHQDVWKHLFVHKVAIQIVMLFMQNEQ